MTIKDKYGYEYEEIEGFELKTTNDFPASLVLEFINSYPEDDEGDSYQRVDYYYPENENGGKRVDDKYIPYYNKEAGPIGYRLTEVEDFAYEGGIIQGIGTFTNIDNGNLGDGHEAWSLLRHEESGRLFRVGGWYSSWDSDEWNEVKEVEIAKQVVQRYKPLGAPDAMAFEYPAVTVKD